MDIDAPIELICTKRSSNPKRLTRCERLAHDEITLLAGLPVTTAARTALDLARHWERDIAVMHLDALAAITDVSMIAIADLLRRYRSGAGVTKARGALRLMDGGAASVRETVLRLAMIDAGFPKPTTQIEVSEGVDTVIVALGWEQHRIALTYADFDDTARRHPWHVHSRNNFLQLQGWINLYVLETHQPRSTVYRVRDAFALQRRRGL